MVKQKLCLFRCLHILDIIMLSVSFSSLTDTFVFPLSIVVWGK